jgi:hypothetical protein
VWKRDACMVAKWRKVGWYCFPTWSSAVDYI